MRNTASCELHIAFDDLDSLNGGCTTHAATYLLGFLRTRINFKLLDFPNLVRLNPSIPWKTRGNGAVAIHILVNRDDADRALALTERFLLNYLNHFKGLDQDPGFIAVIGSIPRVFARFYIQALTDVMDKHLLYKSILELKNVYLSPSLQGRGLIGAAAALGWTLHLKDYTFELITYRSTSRLSIRDRCIDPQSVMKYDAKYRELTFNNIDLETQRILISPHGPDPVLYGVRGEDPSILRKALSEIKVCEPIAAWAIFKTNQATDAHAIDRKIEDLRAYRTARIQGLVVTRPKTIPGGHVIVRIVDPTGCIDAAFFKPSKLTHIAQALQPGDFVEVQGSVRPWGSTLVMHTEKITILSISPIQHMRAPRCPRCGAKLKKLGKGKGFACPRCKLRTILITQLDIATRSLRQAIFIPPPRAQKHLIKPFQRYRRTKPRYVKVTEPAFEIYEPLGFL